MAGIRLDDEGNLRLLDEQTLKTAQNLQSALNSFAEDLVSFSTACEKSYEDSSALSKTLLTYKTAAALKRAELNKELLRREDLKTALQEDINYQTDELRKDRAFLQSLQAVEDRLSNMQENLFLK